MMQHDTNRIRLRHIAVGSLITFAIIALTALAGAIEGGSLS